MKKSYLIQSLAIGCFLVFVAFNAKAQFTFANSNNLIPIATHSGCAVTVVDVNNDGLDDMLVMANGDSLILELQHQDGSFTRTFLAIYPGGNVWGMSAADVDHNGWKDVVTGAGYAMLIKLFPTGNTVVATTTQLAGGYFVQSVVFGDFNNDGWADVEVNDDDDYAKIYMNDGAGNLVYLAKSVNSMTIATGSQSFATETGLNFTSGETVLVGYNASNYMTGTVTSYNSGSGAMVVNVSAVVGSGTFSGWSIHPNVVMNTNINPNMYYGGDPYDSGNYGCVWSDVNNDGFMDLYICHCRQSTSDTSDQRRRDRLFVNDGTNKYTEAGQAHGFEVTDFKQTWTTSFGDIDNDGDFDCVMTNHGENGQILQNDGTGHFTNITASTGFVTNVDPIESVTEDFDNDGYVDILITGGGNATYSPWIVYHNNGNSTFTMLTAPFPPAANGMLSFGTGDLNHDGKMDVFSSYGNVYVSPTAVDDVLYLNSTNNGNHFITFDLTGTISNPDAIGARVTIYGPWGIQIREVRAGESYGTSNTMQCHFGLGTHTSVDSARIDWPSHSAPNHFYNLAADQFVTVVEGTCSITGNVIPGPYVICVGDSTQLTAAPGYSSYLWSNGATSQTIAVSAAGTYSVKVTSSGGCSNISPSVNILYNPTEVPTVTSTGLSSPCAGSVTLTSSSASAYNWTGPNSFTATTQSIQPAVSGVYIVTIDSTCGSFQSIPDTVTVLANPSPTVTGASGIGPISVTLTASGTGTLTWYDSINGVMPIQTGTTYMTPILNATTTYYVEESTSNPGITAHTGQKYHSGTNYSGTNATDGIEIFSTFSGCTLQSVKVYTDSAGTRELQLLDNTSTIIDSLIINLPADTSVITLNWHIPVGTGYQITTKASVNAAHWGGISPYLRRSSTGVSYPYIINNVLSITGDNGSPASVYYYYFYDWVVTADPTICYSPRVPVVANITTTGINTYSENNGVQIYPNPANDEVNVLFQNNINAPSVIELTDITGRLVSSWSVEKPMQGQITKLNVSDITSGTYFLSVKTDTNKIVQKLVLTK